MEISYRACGADCLDKARPLWEKLNRHHHSVSSHFRNYFEEFTFEQRRKGLEFKAETGKLRLLFAENETNRIVGQCIVSISRYDEGEVDSIFVDESFRGRGIADELMRRAMDWLDENHVRSRSVMVVTGNEEAWSFYARYGFYPRVTKLVQLDRGTGHGCDCPG